MGEILKLVLPFRSTGRETHHPILAVCAVLLGPFMVGFHSRLFGIGLVDLRGAFGLGFDEGSWLSTLATAPQMVFAPAVAWLAAAFGIRRVMVGPALIYAVISLMIPFTRDFTTLAVLHVIHGSLLGVFVPATLMIIFRNLPMKWWITAIAIYAFRGAFTVNSGTALLDFYVQRFGWEYLYWQDVVLAPLLAFLAYKGAPRENVNMDLVRHADWGGMLFLGMGMAMLFVAVDQGNRLDWFENGIVLSTFAGGLVLIAAFFVNEMLVERPWAHLGAIGARNVVLLLSVALFYLMSSMSNSALIPNYLTAVAGLRPEQIGATLVTWVCVPLMLMTPIAVWAMHRTDGRFLLFTGLCCFAGASLIGTGLSPDWNGDSFRTMCVLQGAGHILTFLPIIVLTVANGDPKKAIAVAAYIQVIRLLGTQTAQALMTTYLRKGEQLHSYLTGLNVERGSEASVSALAALAHKMAGAGAALSQSRATAVLSQQVQKQANVLSYIDAFWLTFFCAVGGLVILAFVTKAPKGPLTA
ncbi:MFS transporter (plasmid) [Agrobacterium tumefaciens]|uniref:MFS transporter n=1 Tax=Agrobacterium tumefaciens TaxID=358 RepID=A0AAP9EA37_AGRTU|nr:MFS transporter [Agrobacterium tumefaciens]NSZ60021.1 MFS transporter [Agrobacterium tumefaciens]QDY97624.1 MFS transporter [Agrobacterium tumefaciens]UXS12749.1 MFS transporter [Agrobacterium tumefaciens]UXS20111.1 MFS transporter [Agrobacterium tumefaciens]UXS27758.1 MFS transporter [Agrobacterium tumefaciens]